MNWLVRTLSTSVGKKQLMAITGMLFLLFLAAHLVGNLSIYLGAASFNSYSEHVHALGPLLVVMEVGLVLCALVHIIIAVVLFLENRKARPLKYAMDKTGSGGRTLSSRTMPYTGILILLFVIIHLSTVSRFFVDRSSRTIFDVLTQVFSHPGYIIFYTIAMVIVALHVRHGLWSAFQTVGASHPKYMPFIEKASIVFAVIVALGFGTLPLAISFMK
ncbi:MAG: succinate dehydrogenase cytochrome b subunit [Deltaproteobacteria bacterium]|nr:succinate dehydrogenase cytochrome b subunit [Deltaproteobacteria bacterium]MBW2071274.1 succinate dehydrogenase cytochrome b subunit [Deltaproteobacteria bacterium]